MDTHHAHADIDAPTRKNTAVPTSMYWRAPSDDEVATLLLGVRADLEIMAQELRNIQSHFYLLTGVVGAFDGTVRALLSDAETVGRQVALLGASS